MGGEEIVETVGPRIHQVFQPRRGAAVHRFQLHLVDEQTLAQVRPQRGFSFRLRQPAERREVVRLDAIEIVFGLRIGHAEHGIRVALAVHVRDAPVVADDRHRGGLLLPAHRVGGFRSREDGGTGKNRREEQDVPAKPHRDGRHAWDRRS